jgi:hypothetical protein
MSLSREHKNPIRQLSFYFDATGIEAAQVWAVAIDFFREATILHQEYSLSYPVVSKNDCETLIVSPDEALEVLREKRPIVFSLGHNVGNRTQTIRFSPTNQAPGLYSFYVGGSEPKWRPPDWTPLIERLAQSFPLAIASPYDADYGAWQNTSDPKWYARTYGPTEGFRILRPLPPPLDKIERLDISTNPGRFATCNGGPAFVNADLWLGPAFWKYAPCRKEEVLSQPWLKVRDTEHFLHLKAYPEPFTRPDGEQGEIQRKLWQLLFHSDCQWPPNHTPITQSDEKRG